MKNLRERINNNTMLKAALFVALGPLLGYTAFLLLLSIPWVQNQ
jgi:hypothetical protein